MGTHKMLVDVRPSNRVSYLVSRGIIVGLEPQNRWSRIRASCYPCHDKAEVVEPGRHAILRGW